MSYGSYGVLQKPPQYSEKEMIAMLLDQLLEKKDVKLYLELRMEFLRLIEHSEKMKQPLEKRALIDERFKGRHAELKKLLNVISEGTLKKKSKGYYRKVEKLKIVELEYNAKLHSHEWCAVKGKRCKHADRDNNPEIGYTVCTGEYC